MYKNFIAAITWNSINIFIYKAILLIHQIVLFYFISSDLYGVSGTIFAALYLLIGCTNFGFEYSLFTFFSHYVKSKQNITYLVYQCLLKFLTTCGVASIVYLLVQPTPGTQTAYFFMYQFPINLMPYLLSIFIAESIRKYLETIAQLAFLNKKITIIQTTMIAAYVILFWSFYMITGTITLKTIFIPMVIVSCSEVIWILNVLYRWYQTIPEKSQPEQEHAIPFAHMIKEQAFNYINQLSKNLFSPNFLMVLIAYQIGMQQTGKIRFFTNIITLLYMLLNRSVAIPSGALFSSINQESFLKTKQLFLKITNAYIQLLYTLAIVIGITTMNQLLKQQSESQTIYFVLLFILAGFIEYITITYEKLYIVQHKTHQLAIINASSALVFVAIMYTHPLSTSLFLLPMCCIRVITTYLIGLYAYKKWDIRPQMMVSKTALFCGLISAVILNVLITLKKAFL